MTLISSSIAADTSMGDASSEPSALMSAAPLVLVFIVLYVLMIRPQQKKVREHQDMIKALRRGDKIVTGGGIIGTISKVEADDTLMVEIASDVKIRIMRDTISHVVNKTVANDNSAEVPQDSKKDR